MGQTITSSKKKNYSSWLLWWQYEDAELKDQVENYNKLKIYQSYRGISSLMLLFSALVTTLAILFHLLGLGPYSLIDVFLMLILALLVYKRNRWAMILAMVLWTLEKALSITTVGGGIFVVIWWALYMHYFFGAYKVEGRFAR